MARSKKAKVLTSVAAVALAASMIIGGGTYAYLQGVSDDVVNTFNANQVTVELEETKGPNYDIIPGTSQEKDPKVTVNNTVDAYVFVEVTDNTDGLVDYAIEDGWNALGDAYPGVYYREVAANADVKEFNVLKGNTVSYDAALTNENMLDENGELKDGLELTFKAYAIQAEPFANAVEAWNGKDIQFVADEESLKAALEAGGEVVLDEDFKLNNPSNVTEEDYNHLVPITKITEDTVIDLNGKELNIVESDESLPYSPLMISVNSGTTVFRGNGVLNCEAGNNQVYGVDINGGNVIVENGTYYGACTAFQVTKGSLTINGGFFDLAPTCKAQAPNLANYVVNCYDPSYKNGTATLTITGGTFVNFDPSANPEGAGTSYVAEGYTVEAEKQANGDIWYTVVPA